MHAQNGVDISLIRDIINDKFKKTARAKFKQLNIVKERKQCLKSQIKYCKRTQYLSKVNKKCQKDNVPCTQLTVDSQRENYSDKLKKDSSFLSRKNYHHFRD